MKPREQKNAGQWGGGIFGQVQKWPLRGKVAATDSSRKRND